MIKKILFSFSFILAYSRQQQSRNFCETYIQKQQTCSQCENDFSLKPPPLNICKSKCIESTYYLTEKSTCEIICPISLMKIDESAGCLKVPPCPSYTQKGGQFHKSDSISEVLIDHYQKIMISYSYDDNEIKFWDMNTGRFVTTLSGHEGKIK